MSMEDYERDTPVHDLLPIGPCHLCGERERLWTVAAGVNICNTCEKDFVRSSRPWTEWLATKEVGR